MKRFFFLLITFAFSVVVSGQGELVIPDTNFKDALLAHDPVIDTNGDGEIQLTEADGYTGALLLNNKGITNTKGVEAFVNVTQVFLGDNQVVSIDVSQLSNLFFLYLFNNKITSLDVSQNKSLLGLRIENNNLVSLDISENILLQTLDISNNDIYRFDFSTAPNLTSFKALGNDLRYLNTRNTNNEDISTFDVTGNPNLTCIRVDNPVSTPTNWLKDATASYAFHCDEPIVSIPDTNFKNALLNHNPVIDTNNDGEVQVAEAQALDVLNLRNKGILDLTGIEFFSKVERIECSVNNINTLDVSRNVKLSDLELAVTGVSSLDLSNNTELTSITFGETAIKTLDIRKNPNLRIVSGNNSVLEELIPPVNDNLNLKNIFLNNSQLKDLDTSNYPNLEVLTCGNSNLTSLDISENTMLSLVTCNNSKLTSLNLKNGNNTSFSVSGRGASDFRGNPNLTCIEVDDVDYSNTNLSTIKDFTASFSENCSGDLSVDGFELEVSTSIYPNPVVDKLEIKSNYQLEQVSVVNLVGLEVLVSQNVILDTEGLSPGVYILKMIYNEGVIYKKVLKM